MLKFVYAERSTLVNSVRFLGLMVFVAPVMSCVSFFVPLICLPIILVFWAVVTRLWVRLFLSCFSSLEFSREEEEPAKMKFAGSSYILDSSNT